MVLGVVVLCRRHMHDQHALGRKPKLTQNTISGKARICVRVRVRVSLPECVFVCVCSRVGVCLVRIGVRDDLVHL